MRKIIPFIVSLLLMLCLPDRAISQLKKKKIGLALSGGGAKGLAHIGVLKVFEEAGIYPDYITGTSMGSVVGGLYAIGYSAHELDSLAKNLEWTNFFTDTYDRTYRTIAEKDELERYIFSFPVKDKKIKLPKGFVDGQKLTILLSNLTQKVHGIKSFDDFMIPFRCIGGDLETGEAVVFDSGFLPDAIRASISIPSVFEPVERDGRIVVDGMIIRNLPVQDAFDMGADIVIAVDVGSGLYNRDELSSIISVVEQTSSYRMVQLNDQQVNLANVVIRPEVRDFSALDFEPIDSLIAKGEAAALEMLPGIRQQLGKQPSLRVRRKGITRGLPREVDISAVEVIGLVGKDEQTFLKILQIQVDKRYEVEKITEQVDKVAATGFYNNVSYRLIPEGDHFLLKIRADKTDDITLQVGANYHSTFNAGLILNGTMRNAFLQGSKLSIDIRISENPALRADYLYYTKTRPNIGLRLNGLANFYPGFLYLDNELLDEYDFLKAVGRLDVFSELGRHTAISLGFSAEHNRLEKRFLDIDSQSPTINKLTGHFRFDFDNLNRKNYPTKGSQIKLSGNLVFSGQLQNTQSAGSSFSNRYNTYNLLSYRQLFQVGSALTLEWYNWGGYSRYRETDFTQLFFLGRSLPYVDQYIPFSGLNYMERPVGNFAFTGLSLQAEPYNNIFTVFSANYGFFRTPEFTYIIGDRFQSRAEESNPLAGIGFEIGALSNFGPLSLTSEYNLESKYFNFLFRLGFAF